MLNDRQFKSFIHYRRKYWLCFSICGHKHSNYADYRSRSCAIIQLRLDQTLYRFWFSEYEQKICTTAWITSFSSTIFNMNNCITTCYTCFMFVSSSKGRDLKDLSLPLLLQYHSWYSSKSSHLVASITENFSMNMLSLSSFNFWIWPMRMGF